MKIKRQLWLLSAYHCFVQAERPQLSRTTCDFNHMFFQILAAEKPVLFQHAAEKDPCNQCGNSGLSVKVQHTT